MPTRGAPFQAALGPLYAEPSHSIRDTDRIIVHQHGAGTTASIEGSTAASDLHWQALAKKWDCALWGSSYHVLNEKIDTSLRLGVDVSHAPGVYPPRCPRFHVCDPFIVLRDGQEVAKVPEKPAGKFGRPLFQSMTYHDTPSQPMRQMRYVDAAAKAGEKHTYAVISVNSVGLKSKLSANVP